MSMSRSRFEGEFEELSLALERKVRAFQDCYGAFPSSGEGATVARLRDLLIDLSEAASAVSSSAEESVAFIDRHVRIPA